MGILDWVFSREEGYKYVATRIEAEIAILVSTAEEKSVISRFRGLEVCRTASAAFRSAKISYEIPSRKMPSARQN
ncbi:hypothetical protein EYZ11_013087 [Aspergillus tanneri]|uniref:Uncharacterized protein n=1 Tax=Aspergillus tanneri TaxID=1220188 RepID=A0A4S3IYT9_9EURO|nr:hypothetical protein EYZ11_013087 [Aspergillus tanneri]